MKLERDSIEWAIKHLINCGDTDLFPRPIEFDIIEQLGDQAINAIVDIDISNLQPSSSRRFIVPKDDLSYRLATQLDPLDSIILSAIMYQYGGKIESNRIDINENKIFSNRFSPETNGLMYDPKISWNEFWDECSKKSDYYDFMVILDISDFYNQIYHHSLENQLFECELPNQAVKWIMRLLESLTAKISRGIPVGPHSAHLLAEACLVPIDNSLKTRGIEFCRYVDDIVLFCKSKTEARIYLNTMAEILDKQQKLIMQVSKTRILSQEDFQEHCYNMIADRPINDLENEIMSIIEKYSEGNPYKTVYISDISKEDLKLFKEDTIEKIINEYMEKEEYTRLRWFIRRLTQVGHPSAIKCCLNNFEKLVPAINDICLYFVSVSNYGEIKWNDVGGKLIKLLDNELIKSNEYFQLSLYSLFNKKKELNHFAVLLRNHNNVSAVLQREIIITGFINSASDWLRELKEEFSSMNFWMKRAYIISTSILPKDEKKVFLSQIKDNGIFEDLLIRWAKIQ